MPQPLGNDRGINGFGKDLNQAVKNSECQTIMAALQASRSRDQAAEKLGISPRTLRHKLQKLREQGISVTRAYAR
jgi:two-component system response regulator FlrC